MRTALLRAAERCPDPIPRRVRRHSIRRWAGEAPSRIAALLSEWRRRARARRELAALDSRMLHDIGVAPGDAMREINKPFWRA